MFIIFSYVIDVNGKYIPGFGTSYRIVKKPSKKHSEIHSEIEEPEYELVYIPDKYLPAYELRIKKNGTNKTNDKRT